MKPIHSSIPSQFYTGPINTGQPVAASSAQTQSPTLSLANLSDNARNALEQTEVHPDQHHQLMALMVLNGLADGDMHLSSTQDADAYYQKQVNILPENDVACLTVRARLNDQARYDIKGIDLYVVSSDRTESITLPAPTSATRHDEARSGMSEPAPMLSSRLAAAYSQGQLLSALIRQKNPQDFSGKPLPSHASVSTQSMVFSQDDLANAGVPGPSRPPRARTASGEPYPVPSQSSTSSSRSTNARVQDPKNPDKTISLKALWQRQPVPDPDNPEKTITRNMLSKRQQVPDPNNPGESISRAQRSMRKRVPDPDDPSQTVTLNALNQRNWARRQVPDPDNPAETITLNALNQRKRAQRLVPDPDNPAETITGRALDKRRRQAIASLSVPGAPDA